MERGAAKLTFMLDLQSDPLQDALSTLERSFRDRRIKCHCVRSLRVFSSFCSQGHRQDQSAPKCSTTLNPSIYNFQCNVKYLNVCNFHLYSILFSSCTFILHLFSCSSKAISPWLDLCRYSCPSFWSLV